MATSPYLSNLLVSAAFVSEDFVPDGDLSKRFWQQAERLRFDHDWNRRRHYPEAHTEVAVGWSRRYLYCAFWCKYTQLNVYAGEDPGPEKWELWNRDVAEVFVNPQPERVGHYYEFEVAPNGQWIDLEIHRETDLKSDAAWNSSFDHATRIFAEEHLWTCEMRIPVQPMGVATIGPDDEWRINFYRCDGPGDDSVRRFLAWSTTMTAEPSFHVPEHFGRVRFAGKP
jgi:alpha-galactosidase